MVHSRQVLIAGSLVCIAPFVLLVFNRDWFFTPDGFLDPWHYVGLFREYLNPSFSPGAYKLGRLPWILSGFLIHKAFAPVPAAYVLHALFFCITTASLFAALYLMLGRLALAAVVATLFGFYNNAHGSGGWDYHNTAAGAFYLLASALVAWPVVVAGRRLPLIVTGVVIALAVHSNIMLVIFLPVLAFLHLTIVRAHTGEWLRVRAVIARSGWALLGAVLVTAALGLINWMVGREFLFFQSLVSMVSNMLSDPDQYQAPNVRPWSSGWFWAGRYLSLPLGLWLPAVAMFIGRRRSPTIPTDRVARALVLQFVVMAAVFAAWQAAGQTALDWEVVAYPLTLAAIVALAGLLTGSWPEAFERHWLAATIGTAIVSALWLSGALDVVVESIKRPVAPVISVAGAIVFFAGLAACLLRPGVSTITVFVVVFAFGNSLVARGPDRYSMNDPCKMQPEIYAAIVDGGSWLGTLDPTYTRVRTWFDEAEEIRPLHACPVGMARVATSITSMALVPYVTPPFPMPAVDDVPEKAVRALEREASILAVISSRPEPLERWISRLDAMGVSHEELSRHTVPLLESGFVIHAWRISNGRPAHD
jgi:hypothetical protein